MNTEKLPINVKKYRYGEIGNFIPEFPSAAPKIKINIILIVKEISPPMRTTGR
jgi:hypothetical protein